MTPAALIFMLVVWSVVIGMTGYCFIRLLASHQFHEGHDEAQADEVTPALPDSDE